MSTSRTAQILRTLALLARHLRSSAQAGTITTVDGPVTVTDVVTQIGPLYQY